MDSCEAFNKLLQQLALPEGVQVQLKLREFTTPAALYWSLTADAESTFEAILSDAAVESAMAPSVLSTPTAGKLRRLLKECEKICIEGDSPTPPNTLAELALPVAASPNNQLLGIDLGPKLSAVALAKLWDDFAKNYPAEALCGDVRPCRALVQTIWLQKSHNELKFIPWKHITSEVQADREKQSCQQKGKKLLDILALAAGQVDLPECEVTSAPPVVIQKLLSLRATCWALVGWLRLVMDQMPAQLGSCMCLSQSGFVFGLTQTLLRVQAWLPARRSIPHMELRLQLMVWILRFGSRSWTK